MVKEAAVEAAPMGGKRGSIGKALCYAVGHRYRIEILAALHEGPASAKQLSRMIHQPLSNITHHINELLADSSLEVAYALRQLISPPAQPKRPVGFGVREDD